MHSTYLFLALDIARERSAEAERRRLAAAAPHEHESGPGAGTARHLIARAAVAIARLADDTTLVGGESGDVPRLRLRSES